MKERYARQTLFRPIGKEGQARLEQAHVLIVGAGALGAGNAEILARSGVGRLTIVDRDYVEWSNLQRQSLYSEADAEASLPKAVAAARRLKEIRSDCVIEPHVLDCDSEALLPLLDGVDLLIDGTDNFETRFIMNDCAYSRRIPWIYGGCSGSSGMAYRFVPGVTPCLRCLLEEMPVSTDSCDLDGIIAPAVQMTVSLQSAMALKLLSGNAGLQESKLIRFDAWEPGFLELKIPGRLRRPTCDTCGDKPTYPYISRAEEYRTEVLCGRDTVMIRPPKPVSLALSAMAERFARAGFRVSENPYLLNVIPGGDANDCRIVIFRDGRALVHGTDDAQAAKRIYQRYLG